jgi:hypothetical protein
MKNLQGSEDENQKEGENESMNVTVTRRAITCNNYAQWK